MIRYISTTFYSLSDSSYVTTSSSRLYDKLMSKLPESDRLILFKSEASNTGIFADYDSPDVRLTSIEKLLIISVCL